MRDRLPTGLWLALTLGLALLGTSLAAVARPDRAAASGSQIAIIQDPRILDDPMSYLSRFRGLGATTVRVFLFWESVAPDSRSKRIPGGVNLSDPGAYRASGWAPYDQVAKDAQHLGMTVDFMLTGGPPRWADGPNIPPPGYDPYFAWKPSAALYGKFVHAAGERYSGSYRPAKASAPLPAVHFWTLWNEPNFGEDLGPQAIDGSRVSVAPSMYRRLLDAGWSSLRQTGHGRDTILIGSFSAEGRSLPRTRKFPLGLPGDYGQTKPLQFIRTLFCLQTSYQQMRGRYAALRGCPTTAAASRRFRAQHPGLFDASGVAIHPYSGSQNPLGAGAGRHDPDFAHFSQLGALGRALDRATRAYGSGKRYRLYNDEYGYITRPPQAYPSVSPAVAAYYLNWSEYLSWRNPRIASFAQYLLADGRYPRGQPAFASGLLTAANRPKATYYAFRLPLFLPHPSARRGGAAEVWGDVRPAQYMALDSGEAQTVSIQLQPHGRGRFQTARRVTITNPAGYFDVRVPFRSSGNVRLAYTYPKGDALLNTGLSGQTIASRTVSVTVR